MNFRRNILIMFCGLTFLAACAAKDHKFARIYPSMTSDEVAKTMERGPNKVEPFQDGFASWYYGENQCLLMKDEKVVAKDETTTKGNIDTPWGGASEKKLAQCIPPGQEKTKKIQREIETPFGTIKR